MDNMGYQEEEVEVEDRWVVHKIQFAWCKIAQGFDVIREHTHTHTMLGCFGGVQPNLMIGTPVRSLKM